MELRKSEPKVSVLLPVYNQEKFLAETLESILNQTFCDFELLVWDDGSLDDSAVIIREFAAKDNRIIAFYEQNQGRSKVTNELVKKAKTNWCIFLDADDVMLAYRIEKQLNFHLNNPEIDATSCHCNYINEFGEKLGVQRYLGLRSSAECIDFAKKGATTLCAITGLMIKKNVYLGIGGLRSQFWPCDDLDFTNRLIQNGFIVVIIQEILMSYRIHRSSITQQSKFDLYKYTEYSNRCHELISNGNFEITFDEFIALRKNESWMIRTRKRNHHYSMIFLQCANFDLYNKR